MTKTAMKNISTLSASFQSAHITESKDSKNLSSKPYNPWMEKDLQKLGWSEFMKKRAEETLKSINEKQIDDLRRKKILSRTASAPLNIPASQARHFKSNSKKDLVRVSSTGGSHRFGESPRITYDRDFLLNCRESPLSLTPPTDLPVILGATVPFPRRSKKVLEKTNSNISVTSTSSVLSVASIPAKDE